MKKLNYLALSLVAASAVSLAGCKQTSNTQKETVEDIQFDMSSLDTTAVPGNDFYRYATGGWAKANPIPDEYSRYGTFDQLREKNELQIKGLIEELGETAHEMGSKAQKIGFLYRDGMDSVKLNEEKAAPIRDQLAEINKAETVEDIIKLAASLRYYASTPFFGFGVSADDMKSTQNIVHLYQSGLGLGEREYYLASDDKTKELRKGYLELMNIQFQNAGYSEEDAAKAAQVTMKIETTLAQAHFSKEKRRIPALNYHKMKVKNLNDSVAQFDWELFFSSIGSKKIEELNVSQIEPVAKAVELINTLPIEDSKAYLAWCLINSAANYLSDDFVNANFDFFGKQFSGSKIIQPRWKRVIRTVNDRLGEEVGQLYVDKYFPAKAKERMLDLIGNLRKTFDERIDQLTWMSSETKAKAQEKLANIIVKIGYPDKWRDALKLEIKGDSYWADIVRTRSFDFRFDLDKLGKPVDKGEWYMSPQTVNAYYSPNSNEICFPAGILQAPFFYMDADDAVNYGAIGVVIGHEISHGFDDQGSKFDKEGNMINWWTAEDSKKFNERTKVLVDYFNNIKVLDDLHANGEFTLGENIGDHGGLQVAYAAFLKTKEAKSNEKIDNFTPKQRFFLSYANLWAGNIREAEIRRLTKIDPHALGEWRVNGALPHIDAWYEAFDITESDSLYLVKEKRASIW